MSKVITFSRTFPAYHPRAGETTYFVEKIHRSLLELGLTHPEKINNYYGEWKPYAEMQYWKHEPKHHTIRAFNEKGTSYIWKVGDKFSPRVWSGKPYNSPQIIIAPDIEVKKVWEFEMDLNGIYSIDGKYVLAEYDDDLEIALAMNDGFDDPTDMFHWFMPNYNKPKEFSGQIICWNDKIEY